ncbi:MAG: HEAT repeat domain-containing protein [Dehalococcoidia bacterium]|nr:HEAT repeat domain-containing protein [Dehalococcoidia bacterium]
MRGFGSLFGRGNASPTVDAVCAPTVEGLISQLNDGDGIVRERARRALVAMGPRAVEPLLEALRDKRSRVRYEAVMCLYSIADRRAIDGLVEALGDRKFEVRWVAAEGLIGIGRAVVPAVLEALMARADSAWLRDGCRHVLTHFAGRDLHAAYHIEHHPAWIDFDLRDALSPVVDALDHPGGASRAPVEAIRAIESFSAVPPDPQVRQIRHVVPH